MKLETGQPSETGQFIRWTILSVTTLSSFMVAADSTIVIIGIPAIGQDLHSGVSPLGWVITSYILTTAALLLQFGKIGDKYGRKKVYLIGFAIFGASSALCGLNSGIYELIGFRVIQGVGAAMLMVTSYPLLFASFPENQRGTAVGINSVAWAVGAVAGPVAGGFLVSVDWRLIFYVNVPIATIAVLIGMRIIPNKFDEGSPEIKGINPLSAILLAFTVTMTLLWLTFFQSRFAILGLIGFVAFVISERSSPTPLIDKELIASKGFGYSAIALAIANLAYLGILFALTFYYQIVKHVSPILTGLFIAPLAIAEVISSPLVGKLYDRMKIPISLGLIGTIVNAGATIALSAALFQRANSVTISALLVVIGVTGAMVWTPLVTSALEFANPQLRGLANGTCLTLVNLGFAASVAILIAVSATFLPHSVVSQIYFGNISALTQREVVLFNQGMSRSVFLLGIVDLIAIIPVILAMLQQRKFHDFKSANHRV